MQCSYLNDEFSTLLVQKYSFSLFELLQVYFFAFQVTSYFAKKLLEIFQNTRVSINKSTEIIVDAFKQVCHTWIISLKKLRFFYFCHDGGPYPIVTSPLIYSANPLDWFLYDRDLCHKIVKYSLENFNKCTEMDSAFCDFFKAFTRNLAEAVTLTKYLMQYFVVNAHLRLRPVR